MSTQTLSRTGILHRPNRGSSIIIVRCFRSNDGRKKAVRRMDQRDRRARKRIAELSGKLPRTNEPLDLELIVLFGSVSIILLVPWLLHDFRFIFIIPLCLLVVPGLFAVFVHACQDIVRMCRSRTGPTASQKSTKHIQMNRKRVFLTSFKEFCKKIPILGYWGGFL